MKIDDIVEGVIDDILKKHKQPFKEEFKTFIKQVMTESIPEDGILERMQAIKVHEEGNEDEN